MTITAAQDVRRVEEFLTQEAWLLDERQFEGWLELFGPECRYWIPLEDGVDPTAEMSLALDDRVTLEDRVKRLRDPSTHSQNPPSDTSRIVTNTRVSEVERGLIECRSRFVIFEHRLGRTNSYAGLYVHRFSETGRGFRILEKTVLILNRRTALPTITFLW